MFLDVKSPLMLCVFAWLKDLKLERFLCVTFFGTVVTTPRIENHFVREKSTSSVMALCTRLLCSSLVKFAIAETSEDADVDGDETDKKNIEFQ